MKRSIFLAIVFLISTASFASTLDPIFQKRKDYAITLAQKRFDIVQNEKSCLEKSTNGDELNSCKIQTKVNYQSLKEEFALMRKEYMNAKEPKAPTIPETEMKEEVPSDEEQEEAPGFEDKTTINNDMVKPLRPRGGDLKDAKRAVPQKAIKL